MTSRVLLLHGVAGYGGEWRDTAAWLSEGYRVLAPEQRGPEGTAEPVADVSRAAYVQDAANLIERAADGPAVVIGQSLGGHTAMLLAAEHPDLVEALVVAEASPARDPDAPGRVRAALGAWPPSFPDRSAAAAYLLASGFCRTERAARIWADGLVHQDGRWWPRFDLDVLADSLSVVAERDYWDQWSAISCPTLVVRGSEGALTEAVTARMVRSRAAVRAVTIDGAGHDVHLDAPADWLGALAAFLAPTPLLHSE